MHNHLKECGELVKLVMEAAVAFITGLTAAVGPKWAVAVFAFSLVCVLLFSLFVVQGTEHTFLEVIRLLRELVTVIGPLKHHAGAVLGIVTTLVAVIIATKLHLRHSWKLKRVTRSLPVFEALAMAA